jgi:hypothetical protein
MAEKRKPILCLDFDGVIHDYREGWKDGTIYGNATPGFFEWALEARLHFKLVIYSSRSSSALGLASMHAWLDRQLSAWHDKRDCWIRADGNCCYLLSPDEFEFAHEKPPAFLTIDDRAVTFKGDWSEWSPDLLLKFKTWTQT